jgi:uncharacterized protein (TIGR00369 family)
MENLLETLQTINRSALFNQWAGIEVIKAEKGLVELYMPWREEVGQYSGFLHAGVVGALLDTVCGFAAVTATGQRVLASHYSINFLSPALGDAFVAKGKVTKAGKRQIFTAAELFAQKDGKSKLVANGETILIVANENEAITSEAPLSRDTRN